MKQKRSEQVSFVQRIQNRSAESYFQAKIKTKQKKKK
jgi:hypothetical protein